MDLIFTTPGSYINVKDGLFAIKVDGNKTTISPAKVERIIVTTEASITTAVLKLAADHNIDFILLDHHGDPVGRFWYSKFGSITTIRRKQLLHHMNHTGLQFALKWVIDKLTNQIDYTRELAKNRKTLREEITQKITTISSNIQKLSQLTTPQDQQPQTIIGLEGSASRVYFQVLSMCMPPTYHFEGRSRQPAKDPFNAFLNYAYGVLYSTTEKACIIAGLDPYIGFLHTDNYNKPSLVFDIIENFRIYADRVVMKLFSRKMVNKLMLEQLPQGYSLNKEGKRLLMDQFNQYMQESVSFGETQKRNIKREATIQAFCHQLANSLLQEQE